MTLLGDLLLTLNGKVDKKALPKPTIIFIDNVLKTQSNTHKYPRRFLANNLNFSKERSLYDGYINWRVFYSSYLISKVFDMGFLFQNIVSTESLKVWRGIVDLELFNPT